MNETHNFCRICLQIKDDLSKIFVFKGDGYLPNIIYNISGVKISQRQEPAAQICSNCAMEVVAAERTILRCQESEEYLLNQAMEARCSEEVPKDLNDEDVNEKEFEHDDADIDCQQNLSELQPQNEMEYINLEIEPLTVSETKENASDQMENIDIILDLEDEEALLGIHDVIATETNVITTDQVKDKPVAEVKPTTPNSKSPKRKRSHNAPLQRYYLHICNYCDFTTITRKFFIDHLLVQHCIDDSDIYPCPLCEQRFSWRRLLFKHIENKHRQLPAEKIFMCDECGKTYTQKIHLQYHRKQLHEAECLKCPHPNCKSTFNRVSSLRRHFNNLHSQVKRFHCEICDKHFNIWDNWSYHMDVVHQLKKMTCPKCYCPFRNQKKFQQHIVGNFCEKWTFPCSNCKRRFPTEAGLKVHVQNVHFYM